MGHIRSCNKVCSKFCKTIPGQNQPIAFEFHWFCFQALHSTENTGNPLFNRRAGLVLIILWCIAAGGTGLARTAEPAGPGSAASVIADCKQPIPGATFASVGH